MQWIVSACAYQDDLEAPVKCIRSLLLTTILLGFIAALLLRIWIINIITKSLNECVAIANSVSLGNMQIEIRVTTSDENGKLKQAMLNMVESLQRMRRDAIMLSEAAKAGRLDTRANLNQHQGEFREIIQGVNDTLDTVTKPIHVAAHSINSISQGCIPPEIDEEYSVDFNTLRLNLNQCIRSIRELIIDSSQLAHGAQEGNLSIRADLQKHKGDFK
ncbi:MAG TPA: HAMP domain-containing protein [Chitinispirillaceae bacterium]|nr:HAMP domain-containing protein [Chitinispirillaceae bacterium]